MTHPFAGIALHTWTIDETPLAEALTAAKQAGYDAVELRQLDFKRAYAAGKTDADVIATVKQSGNKVCAVGVEYGWMFASGDESKRLFTVFRRQCETAVELGCDHMMSATGQNTGAVPDAITNVKRAGDIAAEYGLKLSLEFNSQHPLVNSLDVAREIVDGAGKPNVGLLIDAYHMHRSGRIGGDFEELPGRDIVYVQFSDVPKVASTGVPRPTDRLPPGQGVVQWTELFRRLAEKGYRGYLSYEAPNPEAWKRPVEALKQGLDGVRAELAKAFPN